MRVRLTGVERFELELQTQIFFLVVLFGNGLEGDLRLEGSSVECIEALRGLIVGTGNCRAIEAPVDGDLAKPGDEGYRQHATARVFLCPTPFT